MKRVCPTIHELLAFDAVMRHGNMKDAADELCVSVSGISKQIAGLEKFLGVFLFGRMGRGVQATSEGGEYWLKISSSLRTIETATVQLMRKDQGSDLIVLACAPTFLEKWLIQRLPAFNQRYLGTAFVFKPHVDLHEPFPREIDIAISHGLGEWPDILSDYIAGRQFVCIYSPRLMKRGKTTIRTLEELLSYPLLHVQQATLSWEHWGTRRGICPERTQSGICFSQYSAVIQAAANGLGTALVPRILVEKRIKEGSLVVYDEGLDESDGHYLCYRARALNNPTFIAFRSWILDEGIRDSGCPCVV